MNAIPIPEDVADLVGSMAEHVENRSLLLQKFSIPKYWIDDVSFRKDEAARWSILRICDGGSAILRSEADKALYETNKGHHSKGNLKAKLAAAILPKLADTIAESPDAQNLRASHSRRLLQLARSSLGDQAVVFTARLQSRLAINLSDSLIENAGISLDRLFGLPVLPGSALKGVARHVALAELKATAPREQPAILKQFIAVFGASKSDFSKDGALASFSETTGRTDQKGAVTFLAASPVDASKLEVDLTNVHIPNYYTGLDAGTMAKLKDENPRPNPFPTVAAGTAFGFVVALNQIGKQSAEPQSVLTSARRWLEQALTVSGIGGKTGAGYGWFALDTAFDEEIEAAAREEEKRAKEAAAAVKAAEHQAKEEEARRADLDPAQLAMEDLLNLEDPDFAATAKNLPDQDAITQLACLRLLLDQKKDRWKAWKKKKPAIADAIRKTAEAHQFELP